MTPAPSSTPDSREPPALALRRLERVAPQLAEAWLVRLFQKSSRERMERLAAGALPASAPELIVALLRVAGESESVGQDRLSAAARAVEARERWLDDLAHTDPLTGLFNRRHLDSRLRQLLADWRRHAQPFALLLLDVDQLKRINDAHGHAAGDRVLIDLANAITHSIRTGDTALRISGDEFCVLAPHENAADAAALAERLIAAAAKPPIAGAGARPTSISVGIVACPEHGDQPEAMLELADRAMYTAKRSGKAITIAPRDDHDVPGDGE